MPQLLAVRVMALTFCLDFLAIKAVTWNCQLNKPLPSLSYLFSRYHTKAAEMKVKSFQVATDTEDTEDAIK